MNLVLMEEQIKAQNKINEVRYRERLDEMNLSLHTELNDYDPSVNDSNLVQVQ